MKLNKLAAGIGLVLALAAAAPMAAFAKDGADDPPAHVGGGGGVDNGPNHR